MRVEIHIAGKMIEAIDLDWNRCNSYEERKAEVFNTCAWLKYRYRATIALKRNWEIILSVDSKLNNKPKKKNE
jgi:hypothetical protein